MAVRGRHGHGGSGRRAGHQVSQPSTASGQGQKILSRGRVPRCVSTLRAQGDQALRAGGPSTGRQGQQGHVKREARDAAQDEQRHEHHRQTPAEQHKATTPEATAPRSGSPSGQTRRAQERAPASHREERQAATPTKAAQLTPEADARRAVIREAKRAESPARPGRKADQESPLRGGGERGGAFWAVQFHWNHAEKCP